MADDPGKSEKRKEVEEEERRCVFDAPFLFLFVAAVALLSRFAPSIVVTIAPFLFLSFSFPFQRARASQNATETKKNSTTTKQNRLVRPPQGPAQERPPGARVPLREEACLCRCWSSLFFKSNADAPRRWSRSRSRSRSDHCCCCCCCSCSLLTRWQGQQRRRCRRR